MYRTCDKCKRSFKDVSGYNGHGCADGKIKSQTHCQNGHDHSYSLKSNPKDLVTLDMTIPTLF